MRVILGLIVCLSSPLMAIEVDCHLGPISGEAPAEAGGYGIGRAPDPERLAAWDIDVSPDGAGLPDGSGTVEYGASLYAAQCASCHGRNGEGTVNDVLVADPGDQGYTVDRNVPKAIGNYWPFATTLFDYIRRAMPHTAPGSLNADEVYSLTAFLLHRNGLIDAEAKMDRLSLPAVKMPAAALLRRYDECEADKP